jgi:hypothetical protein
MNLTIDSLSQAYGSKVTISLPIGSASKSSEFKDSQIFWSTAQCSIDSNLSFANGALYQTNPSFLSKLERKITFHN